MYFQAEIKLINSNYPNVFTGFRLESICASETWLISSATRTQEGKTQNTAGRTTKAIYFPAALSSPKRGRASVLPLKFTCPYRSIHNLTMADLTSDILGISGAQKGKLYPSLVPAVCYIFKSTQLLTHWKINKKTTFFGLPDLEDKRHESTPFFFT